MTDPVHAPMIRKSAFVGGLVGGALGAIIVQIICCLLAHYCHQLPIK